MKIALFGAGTMGRLVNSRAKDDGHEVALILTSRDKARSVEDLRA